MSPVPITSDQAPAAVGAYSQAVRTGDLVFCSGQLGINPETGEMVSGGVPAETDQCLRNLSAVLEAAGLTLADVVKATVYLADIDDFKAMNEVYATYFELDPPARAAFAVKGLPLGAQVEIEAVATDL